MNTNYESFVVFFVVGESPASEFYVPTFRNTLFHLQSSYEQEVFVSLKYNQQDATFSRSIYFYKLLYMFQAVPPPIIRSTKT